MSNRDAGTLHILGVQRILLKLQQLLKAHAGCGCIGAAAKNRDAVCSEIERQILSGCDRLLGRCHAQALPQKFSGYISQRAALVEREQLHLAHHVVGEIKGCFHRKILPALWVAVKLGDYIVQIIIGAEHL